MKFKKMLIPLFSIIAVIMSVFSASAADSGKAIIWAGV